MIYFLGTSHAAMHLKQGAVKRGLEVTEDIGEAQVIFVSEDTPTDDYGRRDLNPIMKLISIAAMTRAQVVLTSQVPPGFTRSLGMPDIYYQAETLRIKDAEERAYCPDYIAVGGPLGVKLAYAEYLVAFHCPVIRMTWEEAEFSKIAVNMFLAAQVDRTNLLAKAAEKAGAKWENVAKALKFDKRIGPHAYLTPGRWENSKHLLRDWVTLEALRTS